jgi:hypothetical protein
MLIRLIIAVAIIGQSAAAAFADAPLTVLNDCVRQGAAKPDPDSPFSEATRRKLTLATCMTLQATSRNRTARISTRRNAINQSRRAKGEHPGGLHSHFEVRARLRDFLVLDWFSDKLDAKRPHDLSNSVELGARGFLERLVQAFSAESGCL